SYLRSCLDQRSASYCIGGSSGCGCIHPMRNDRPSTMNSVMDSIIRMVSNFAVRSLFSLSLMKVNMLAARLASIRTNSIKMINFISIILGR
ncbi:MAG: hypothetical protein ACI9KM_002122, partial [Rubritalea sp.]